MQTIGDDTLSILCCPAAKAQGREEPLTLSDGVLTGLDRYPIIEGVPDLRLSEARKGTSYDHILPEGEPLSQEVVARIAPSMCIDAEDLRGKRVLVAGAGAGTELDLALSCAPAQVYALDFSSHIIALSNMRKYQESPIVWLMGDLCNLPFRNGVFDYALNGGVMQATRSPELAHRNIWYAVRPGGLVNYASIYGDGLHNWRVTIDRNKYQFHRMAPEEAKRKLFRLARVYEFLINKGLLYLYNRLTRGRLRFPLMPELNGTRGLPLSSYRSAFLDYYLCRYRHVIPAEDVMDWFRQVGADAERTPKGWLARKPA